MNFSHVTGGAGDDCEDCPLAPTKLILLMIGDIRNRVDVVPFVPFDIVTSSGARYHIRTRDHLGFNPKGTRVVVWFDDGGSAILAPLHITSLDVHSGVAENRAE
jgi:hypothetical protein